MNHATREAHPNRHPRLVCGEGEVMTSDITPCPTCGSPCRVVGGTTQYYAPVRLCGRCGEEMTWGSDGFYCESCGHFEEVREEVE